jgi:hypothetical protein
MAGTTVVQSRALTEQTGQTQWETTIALLQRVIAPRAGDPLDVRVLYVDEAPSATERGPCWSAVRC